MARSILPLLAIVLSLLSVSGQTESAATAATSFIRAKCSGTTYPSLCVQSLFVYASTIQRSPRQLAQTALSVSLQRAQSAKSFITKLSKLKGLKYREYAAIRDCLEEMSDNVNRLSKSVKVLKSIARARGEEIRWRMSNVQTWVSAALTDDTTCTDGFSGKAMHGRIKVSITARVNNVAQVTSNALALINQYAATQ